MPLTATSLKGRQISLEPLAEHHKEGLCAAIMDGQLWSLFVTLVPHPEQIDSFFAQAYAMAQCNEGLAYAIVANDSGQVIGSTRFMKAHWPYRRIEIGYTFLAKRWQKTLVNTEAKYLMLNHAFDQLAVNRVEFLTDYLNDNSRRAILRLGAKQEGILRDHMVMPDGRVRDSVLFSIVRHEWPGIRQHLLYKMARDVNPSLI